MGATEKKQEEVSQKLMQQCAAMGLSARTKEYCREMYQLYTENVKVLAKTSINAVILGILFFACKNNGAPRTIKELAKETHTTQDEVRRGMKLVSKRCASLISSTGDQVTSQNLLERYCTKLGLEYSFTSKALEVDAIIRKYVEGRRSNTLAAADIAIAFRWYYKPTFVFPSSSFLPLALARAAGRGVSCSLAVV